MISLRQRFLFIHVPKTAGNSIQNILKDHSEDKIVSITPYQDGVERFEIRSEDYKIHKHSTLWEYEEQLGKSLIDRLFKFSCVRNPWDRMISYYFSPHRGSVVWDRFKFINMIENTKAIREFVRCDGNNKDEKSVFENIDFFIRYESINQDFDYVCKQIGIPSVQLPHRNVSNHLHFSVYYDEELIEIVRDLFNDEISYFNYKLDW